MTEYKVYGLKHKITWHFVYKIEKKENPYCKPGTFNYSISGYLVDFSGEYVIDRIGWCLWTEPKDVTYEDEAYILSRVLDRWTPQDRGVKLDNENQLNALLDYWKNVKRWKEYPEEPLKSLV